MPKNPLRKPWPSRPRPVREGRAAPSARACHPGTGPRARSFRRGPKPQQPGRALSRPRSVRQGRAALPAGARVAGRRSPVPKLRLGNRVREAPASRYGWYREAGASKAAFPSSSLGTSESGLRALVPQKNRAAARRRQRSGTQSNRAQSDRGQWFRDGSHTHQPETHEAVAGAGPGVIAAAEGAARSVSGVLTRNRRAPPAAPRRPSGLRGHRRPGRDREHTGCWSMSKRCRRLPSLRLF